MERRPRARRLALSVAWSLGLLGLVCWLALHREWVPGPGDGRTSRSPAPSGVAPSDDGRRRGDARATARPRGGAARAAAVRAAGEGDEPPGRLEPVAAEDGSRPSADAPTREGEDLSGVAQPSVVELPSPLGIRAVDAATGAAIRSARVRATAFHGSPSGLGDVGGLLELPLGGSEGFAAGSGVKMATAWPPLDSDLSETDPEGRCELRRPLPDDPRVPLYVEVSHPDYATGFLVLPADRETLGRSEVAEVPLRRARTAPFRLIDAEGRGLAHAPLEVTPFLEGHDFLEAEGVRRIRRTGRLVARGSPRLLHTDGGGWLRLPVTGHEFELALLHPLYFFEDPDAGGAVEELVERVMARPSDAARRSEWVVRPGWPARHRLLDGEGAPVAGAELEIELEGMTPRWVRTDPQGRFEVGVRPRARGEPPLGPANPRLGRLTIWTPDLFKRQVRIALPGEIEILTARALPADRLRLRTVVEGDEETIPVRPRGLDVSASLTLVRREGSGAVEYVGSVPAPGEILEVRARGYLPSRVVVPATGRAGRVLDVGDVVLRRGWEREIAVEGLSPLELRGAVVQVREAGPATFVHRYPLGERARVRAGGLRRGEYEVGVQGPWMRPVARVVLQTENDLDEPIILRPDRNDEEVVKVLGEVAVADPLEAGRIRVVERYRLRGALDPISASPYPLASPGRFGSRRTLSGVEAVEVALVAENGLVASDAIRREPGGAPVFDFGVLRLRPQRQARIRFVVDGLGTVVPPPLVSLLGPGGAEAAAFLGLEERRLVVENVLPGNYTLRWRGPSARIESFGFAIEDALVGSVDLTAARAAGDYVILGVLATDSAGRPVPGASATPAIAAPYEEALPPGVCLVRVTPQARNRFEVRAPGLLGARVDVPAGRAVPTQLTMYRPASVCAELLDPAGRRVDGPVLISWEPIEPTAVRHGSELEVWVRQGMLRVTGLPPLHRRFTLRLGDSDVEIRRDWTLTEEEDCAAVGILRFSETRFLEGTVRLQDGSPASEATVALVPSGKARRLPLVGGGVEEGLYSTRTDALGSFRLDGLPLDLRGDLALVAHLDGATDAVEDPVDLDAEGRRLRLDPECVLSVDAGYADGRARESFGFWLEFLENPADPESHVTLGEIEPGLPGGYEFAGIEPGVYRLRWTLREPYAPIPGRFREARASPGWAARLALRLEGRRLRGRASLNGEPVERGWILLTDDPGLGGATSVGRVIDGQYELVDPPQALAAYAAVIPEGKPQALQNPTRGEALPARIDGYRGGLGARWLDVDYAAYDLTLLFGEGFLARYPGSRLGIDYYEWDRGRFRPFPGDELIEEPRILLRLLQPGSHRISVRSARGSLLYSRLVVLRENLVLRVKD